MLKKIFKQKIKSRWLLVGVMILALVLFFNVHYVKASVISWVGEGVIYAIVGWVVQLLAYVVGKLLNVITYALFWVANLDNFVNNGVVQLGWPVVRDLCNMFFILILLVIAFATILRIENYSVKKLLPKLIIMAVLINFSKTICGLFIDFSQVIMLTFMKSLGNAEGNLYQALGLGRIFSLSGYLTAEEVKVFTLLASLVLGLILLIIAGIVITIFTVILFFRMVALWILIILSPLAFIASILPGSSKYFSQWLSQFTNYLIVGPVMAFFLWLALATVGQVQFADFNKELESTAKSDVSAALTEAGSKDNMIKFIVSICLLLGGLMAAQQLGVAGGKAAGGALSWLQKAPMRGLGAAGKRAAHFGVRKLDESQQWLQEKAGVEKPISLRPTIWKKAWELRRQRVEEEAEAVPTGKAQDVLERILGINIIKRRLGRKTDFARIRHQQVLSKHKKEAEEGGLETNQLMARLYESVLKGEKYDIEATALLATRGQDLNEIFKDERLQDKFQKDFGRKLSVNPQDVQDFCKKYIGGERGAQLAAAIGYEALDKGDVHMYALASVNTRTGKFEYTTPAVQKMMQAQYRMKKEPQVDTRTTRAQSMFEEGIITAVDADTKLKTKLTDEKGKDIKVDDSNYFGTYTERDKDGNVVKDKDGKPREGLKTVKIQGEWRIMHIVDTDKKTGRITEATVGEKVKQPSNVQVDAGLNREISEHGKEQLKIITQGQVDQAKARMRAETAQFWGDKNRLESMIKFALSKEVKEKGEERQKLILDYVSAIAAQAGTYDKFTELADNLLIGDNEKLRPKAPNKKAKDSGTTKGAEKADED